MRKLYFTLLLYTGFGFAQERHVNNKEDTFAVKSITEDVFPISCSTLLLNESANNASILSLFEESFDKQFQQKQEIRDLMAKILIKENHDYIKSQIKDSQWSTESISLLPCKVKLVTKKEINAHYKPNLYISKPVYTKNNLYALVTYTFKSMYSLIIFRKEKNEWVKEAFVPLGIL